MRDNWSCGCVSPFSIQFASNFLMNDFFISRGIYSAERSDFYQRTFSGSIFAAVVSQLHKATLRV